MTAAHANPPTTQKPLQVTAPQLAALTLIEVTEAHLATAADRLLTIGQADAGHAIGEAFKLLGAKKVELVKKWQSGLVIAQPGDLQAIGSKR